nr:DNA binding domain [uncultured Mediterranean phage uvMED]
MKFYHFLKKNPEMNERITEARKNGVQTLIDKLLQVFQYQEIENPNQILWIREKTKFITFLANKLTDLYSDNKVQNVKTDQSIKISWEDNQSDMIDVSEDVTDITPSDNKD